MIAANGHADRRGSQPGTFAAVVAITGSRTEDLNATTDGVSSGRARECRPVACAGVLGALTTIACGDATAPAEGFAIEPSGGVITAIGDSLTLTFPPGAVASTVRMTIDRVAHVPPAPA